MKKQLKERENGRHLFPFFVAVEDNQYIYHHKNYEDSQKKLNSSMGQGWSGMGARSSNRTVEVQTNPVSWSVLRGIKFTNGFTAQKVLNQYSSSNKHTSFDN